MPEGLGTPKKPYLIQDARDLGAVWFEPLAHYRLETSVDLSEITWSMAVIPCFGGTFDGNGHGISNLHIHSGGNLGLFGTINSDAKISSLGLEAVDVNGIDSIGGLVGKNLGTIAECYVTGGVSGRQSVGGMAGSNLKAGSIVQCYAACTVQADELGGGLVGANVGQQLGWFSPRLVAVVSDCYSIVLGNSRVSGLLVGQNGEYGGMESGPPGEIINCYATCDGSGPVQPYGLVGWDFGRVMNCFWDAETRGVGDNAEGGTPKTTAEMQTASTFLEAGWDFIDETTNGTEDIWWILEGQDYPRLWWELIGD